MDTGDFAPSRIEPTTIAVVMVPSSSRHAAIRRSSTAEMALNGVVSALAVGQAGESRSRRGAAATHPRHALAAPAGTWDARTHVGDPVRSPPQPIHALLHSDASVRPRRARPAAGGTSRRRRPATRLRQCVAAEQLRGDDGAQLRSLLPKRSERRWRPTRRLLLVVGVAQRCARGGVAAAVEQCVRAGSGLIAAGAPQAPAAAIWCVWSFIRLWVAVISRHSERTADLPRRWKLSMRRLCLVCANTGSTIALRLR